jgi:transketolase
MERIGVRNRFGESGTANELMDAYGLRAKDIAEAALRVVKRKR